MSSFLDKEAFSLVREEVAGCVGLAPGDIPDIVFSARPEVGDFSFNVGRLANKEKAGAAAVAQRLVDQINAGPRRLIAAAKCQGAYVNLDVDKTFFLRLAVLRIEALGDRYGSSTQPAPKRIIVEHTSANPNAPLHVGNLRNVMIGAHLARLQRFCGCEVKEYFFVNDLGGQIGLTALGYHRLTALPAVKPDHLIGSVYAIMNTFADAQKLGFKLSEFQQAVLTAPPEPEEAPAPKPKADEAPAKGKGAKAAPAKAKAPEPAAPAETPEEKAAKTRLNVVWTGQSLFARYEQLYTTLFSLFTDDDDIPGQSAALNKAYEDRDPGAVAIFRKMACDTLTGHQATLDIYGVRHDRFDFESELSWDGTSGALIDLLSRSKYFHPQTACNAKGVPEGAFIDLDAYLRDIGAKRGKGGYCTPYPPFYVMRPDGSTLYTLRDVAYSMKKISEADMVLNVICTEQNLPQEKVMLSLKALGIPGRPQFHMPYELVKLTRAGEIQRMSGRRGIYFLADELYEQLREASYNHPVEKKQVEDDAERRSVAHTLATAAMKYSLLSVSPRMEIAFDVAAAVDPKGNSAAFILYSGARIQSILRKFEKGVAEGKFQPAPPEVDWSLLTEPSEWLILVRFLMPFATLIREAALPEIPGEPRLPEFGTHIVPQFAYQLANLFSSYYAKVKVLSGDAAMYTRIRFCKAVQQVINNALRLFMVEPLEAM